MNDIILSTQDGEPVASSRALPNDLEKSTKMCSAPSKI